MTYAAQPILEGSNSFSTSGYGAGAALWALKNTSTTKYLGVCRLAVGCMKDTPADAGLVLKFADDTHQGTDDSWFVGQSVGKTAPTSYGRIVLSFGTPPTSTQTAMRCAPANAGEGSQPGNDWIWTAGEELLIPPSKTLVLFNGPWGSTLGNVSIDVRYKEMGTSP